MPLFVVSLLRLFFANNASLGVSQCLLLEALSMAMGIQAGIFSRVKDSAQICRVRTEEVERAGAKIKRKKATLESKYTKKLVVI